jgi:replicative DNA helicase
MSRSEVLPYDREAEQGVLGAVIHRNAWLTKIAGLLLPAHFFLPAHRDIYTAMLELQARIVAIDEITLVDVLRGSGRLSAVGGPAYVAELRDLTPAASNATAYAKLVYNAALRRDLIGTAMGIEGAARAGMQDAFELVTSARAALEGLSQSASAGTAQTDDTTGDIWRALEARLEPEAEPDGPPVYTYTSLDAYLGRLAPGYGTVIAARTSMGKSAFACQVAMRNAAFGVPVAVFSLEMKPVDLVARLACGVASIDSFLLLKGRAQAFKDAEWERLMSARGQLIDLPLYWPRVRRDATMAQIMALGEYYVRERGVRLLVLDHLGLVRVDGSNIYERMTAASHQVANLAARLDVPVLVVVQINREGGKAEAPAIHHMEGSGAIEQDAETIVILHGASPDSGEDRSEMTAIIGKARDGRTGKVRLHFEPEYLRFDHGYWMERLRERQQGAFGVQD